MKLKLVLGLMAMMTTAHAGYDIQIPATSIQLQTADGYPLVAEVEVRVDSETLVFSRNSCVESNGHGGAWGLPGFCRRARVEKVSAFTTNEKGFVKIPAMRVTKDKKLTRPSVSIYVRRLHGVDTDFSMSSLHYDTARTTHGPSTKGKLDYPCGVFLVRSQKVLDTTPGAFNCTLNKSWKDLRPKAE